MIAALCAVCGSDPDAHETKIHAFVGGGPPPRARYGVYARTAVPSCPAAHRWRGEMCPAAHRWRGEMCRVAWPVSRFAWCEFCREGA